MSNLEDQDTPVENNEQERDGSEATSPRRRNGPSAQGGDLELWPKRRSISGVYHKMWQATVVDATRLTGRIKLGEIWQLNI